jgi:hypothetical protein
MERHSLVLRIEKPRLQSAFRRLQMMYNPAHKSSNPQDKRYLCEDIAVDRRSIIDLRHKCREIFTTNEYYRLNSELAQFKRLIPENGRACTKRIAPV